jgi:transposase
LTTLTANDVVVTGGVDTHQDLHVAAALDQLGRVLGIQSFATTPAGYRQMLGWLRGFGRLQVVGVEGTGSYGSALARHLTSQGIDVIEVARPNRQLRRRMARLTSSTRSPRPALFCPVRRPASRRVTTARSRPYER